MYVCQAVLTPRKETDALICWISAAPASAPMKAPRPPKMLAPPSTTAVMLVERVGDSRGRVAGADLGHQHEAGEEDEQAADEVGAELHPGDPDADRVGVLGVGADGAQLHAPGGPPQRVFEHEPEHDRDHRDPRERVDFRSAAS